MKKIVLLFFSFFLFFVLSAQDGEFDLEEFDPTEVCNWLDPSYEDFFSQPVTYSKVDDIFTILPTHTYNQGIENPPNLWYQNIMGEKDNCTNTIGRSGCAITCQAMILKSRGFSYNPGTWDTYLKDVVGYSGCGLLFQKEAMYNNTLGNFYHISKQYPLTYKGSNDDYMAAKVLKYWIDRGAYAIIKVNRIAKADGTVGATASHFILVKGYYTKYPTLKDFIVSDPGTIYDDNRNVKLEHYYVNEKSPLIVSKTGYPTIRIYANLSASEYQPPEMPDIFPPFYETGNNLNINLTTTKLSGNFDISWILKKSGITIYTQNGPNFSYYLTKPGNYTITLIVGGDQGITETTKSFTVTGDPIIQPGDCPNAISTIESELDVTHTTIFFEIQNPVSPNYPICSDDNCNWHCGTAAIEAVGPNIDNFKYGCRYNYTNLKPNTHYIFYEANWNCDLLFHCENTYTSKYCQANIVTTPNEFERNSKITKTGNVSDKAFQRIVLTSGFSYKPQSAGDSYSASIATGKQFWFSLNNDDKKESEQAMSENEMIDNDCEETYMDTVFSKQESIESELKISISPNPSHGIFNIDINKNVDFEVMVYNLQRKILYVKNKNQINLSNFPSGFYIIKVKANGFEKNERIIKID